MKKQIFKKMMAYLLVGAMVVTTPMATSARMTDIMRAYGIEVGSDESESFKTSDKTDDKSAWKSDGKTDEISANLIKDLEDLLKRCDDLEEEDYTVNSWKDFQSAISKANKLIADYKDKKQMHRADIVTEYNNVVEARNALVNISELKQLVDEGAKRKDAGKQETDKQVNWDAFEEALEKAQNVLGKNDATKDAVKAAYTDLKNALDKLDSDKSELEEISIEKLKALVEQCKEDKNTLNKSDYKATYWNAFENALQDAEDVVTNFESNPQNVTQTQINTAYTNLESARAALGTPDAKTGEEGVTVEKLRSLVKQCEDDLKTLNKAEYKVAYWDAFENALKEAKDVLSAVDNNQKVDQTQIDSAYTNLNNAREALKTPDAKSSGKSGKTAEIDDAVNKFKNNILGIVLDKELLDLDVEESDALRARVLFDSYSAVEGMEWADLGQEKEDVIKSINWYSENPEIAKVTKVKGADTTVEAIADGYTYVYAWIEADGVYSEPDTKQNDRPTAGDFVAKAIVNVTEYATGIDFDDCGDKFVVANEYDLRDYTKLMFGSNSKWAKDCNESVTYSFEDKKLPSGVKATLTDTGFFKITKGNENSAAIKINAVTESGLKKTFDINISKQTKVNSLEVVPALSAVDLGTVDSGNGVTISDGKVQLMATLKVGPEGWTDNKFVWSTSNKKIASVEGSHKNVANKEFVEGNTAIITLTGDAVGKVKITAKAITGKKYTATIEVSATPDHVEIKGVESTYTGRPITLEGALKGVNGMDIPATSKTKVSWSVGDKSYAKVSSKGVVTPANILYAKNGTKTDKTNYLESVAVNVTAKSKMSTVKEDTKSIAIKQSNVQSVEMFKSQYQPDGSIKYEAGKISAIAVVNKNEKTTYKDMYTGPRYSFKTVLMNGEENLSKSVAWTITGKGIISSIDGDILDVQLGTANTTIKASYITLSRKGEGKPWSAKKITKTITIQKPIQKAEGIVLNKNEFVAVAGKKTNVAISVKSTIPKKASYSIASWKAKGATYDETTKKWEEFTVTPPQGKPKTTITIPATTPAGSVIKVGAYTDGGAVAYAYIYVVEQTKALKLDPDVKKATLTLGDKEKGSYSMETKVNDVLVKALDSQGTTSVYKNEPVTYTVDKKGASVIKLDVNSDGKVNVTALKKGTATVTVKTLSGKKKATIKFTVE